jgi:hypothetical protein
METGQKAFSIGRSSARTVFCRAAPHPSPIRHIPSWILGPDADLARPSCVSLSCRAAGYNRRMVF